MEQGMMLVISGPSGVGKGTLAKRLMEEKGFAFSVSCTTRAPRPMEVEGKDYYFITEEEFARKEKAGEFLETALVHKHHYGTPLAPAREAIVAGRDLAAGYRSAGGDAGDAKGAGGCDGVPVAAFLGGAGGAPAPARDGRARSRSSAGCTTQSARWTTCLTTVTCLLTTSWIARMRRWRPS